MSDEMKPTNKAEQLQTLEQVRDLFARSHDYIAQATYPGHMGIKIAEALNFLQFQFTDLKTRAEALAKQIEAEKHAENSKVDVAAAQNAVDAVLSPEAPKA